jgi:predicted nuclease of restriction endonuclease-like (RecB) superfamily
MSAENLLPAAYQDIRAGIVALVEAARTAAARSVNTVMTSTYWEIGHRIVAFEQGGEQRAEYGEALVRNLAADLTQRFGRGFGFVNLTQMRRFYQAWPPEAIVQTLSELSSKPLQKGHLETQLDSYPLASRFPLPWSAYVRLLTVRNPSGRAFYETKALRGGWSVRQLDRQIESQFYERTILSRNKAAMLQQGVLAKPSDRMTPEEAIKDPFVLEFLDLNDQYSESELEAALIQHLTDFLLELGDDFAFVGRQRRLRLDDTWFRVDLLFFHRRLKCLVIIDLKAGRFSHADAGQMHLYLNYAREHWTREGENPPVGLIPCAAKGAEEARYALDNLSNKVLAAQYQTVLPDEKQLAEEIERTRRELETRQWRTLPEPSKPAARKRSPAPRKTKPKPQA